MNLIYMCVFHQQSYINLLKLLINSISVKGNVNKDTTDILIITSPGFQPIIQKDLEGFALPISYYLLDLNSLMESSCCKLKIFSYSQIDKYQKILYLDTDVLVNSDINVLFSGEISSDKLYALEEGNIGHEYWGSQFFDFTKFDKGAKAFSAGVFYFMNSLSMKNLFEDVNMHINNYIGKKNPIPVCLDQPFLVFNSFSQGKCNNQFMKKYLENNPSVINDEKIIYHFPGGPGNYSSKLAKMTTFWEKMKKCSILCLLGKKHAVDKSPFFGNHTYTPEYHNILKDIRNNTQNILEIGIGNVKLMQCLTNDSYKPGASLRMWRDYFPNANVFGCDILTDVLFTEERITTFQTDQSNENSLNALISNIKTNLDLIIDDGSHIQEHMVTTFKTLWKSLKVNGIYIIEDIHISFINRIANLNSEFNMVDANCIMVYKGKFVSDNFVAFQKMSIFDTRNDMLKFYCDKVTSPKILEIGVFKGEFLHYLEKNCNWGSIDAVDLFEGTTCSGDADGNNVVHCDVGKSYLELLDKYKEIPNIKIHKSNSIHFLQKQEENTYDIIYIDGDHSYKGVKQDLTNAFSKIKNGGYIMGHDYEMNMKKAKHKYNFGVKQAVDEFCITYNQTMISKALDGCVSYCILISRS